MYVVVTINFLLLIQYIKTISYGFISSQLILTIITTILIPAALVIKGHILRNDLKKYESS